MKEKWENEIEGDRESREEGKVRVSILAKEIDSQAEHGNRV